MQKKITIRIAEDGTIYAETQGIKGKDCTPYIQLLEQLLDAETVDSEYTDEYYESNDIDVLQSSKQVIERKE